MKIKQFFVGLVVCLAIQGSVTAFASDYSTRIIGGGSVTSDITYPFYTALVSYIGDDSNDDNVFMINCGATYLGDGLVLTAAHCFNGTNLSTINSSRRIYITDDRTNVGLLDCNAEDDCTITEDIGTLPDSTGSGMVDSDGDPVVDVVSGVVRNGTTENDFYQYEIVSRHPFYTLGDGLKNDMALVRIFSNSPPAITNAPVLDDSGSLSGDYTVIGYGNTTFDDTEDEPTEPFAASADLQEVLVPFVDDSTCESAYPDDYDVNSMICAGFDDGTHKDSCQGDSGGPIFKAGTPVTVVGVVSFGDGCAENFGVYSSTYKLRRWLNAAQANLLEDMDFPVSYNFGSYVSTSTVVKTFTWEITNNRNDDITLKNFSFSGLSSAFALNGTDCPTSGNVVLENDESCEMTVTGTFTGEENVYKTGVITFDATIDGTDVPMEISVFGKSRLSTSSGGSSSSGGGTTSSSSSSGGSVGWAALAVALLLAIYRFGLARKVLLVAVAGTAISACATSASSTDEYETIYNPEFSGNQLQFDVVSNGCTSADDLSLSIDGDMVAVSRLQEDMCRATPHLVHVSLVLPEASSDWVLKNPVRQANSLEKTIKD